uniref:Neprosin PEP catalytic domain-containing protein n=1 Tax=Chenopodium quinoa TaxID=63459 RepID=A0A803M0K8_CHEQI
MNKKRRPSFIPEEKRVKRASSRLNRRQYNQGEFKGCSHGTVPFRRVQKEDLINDKAIRDLRRPRSVNLTQGLTPEMHVSMFDCTISIKSDIQIQSTNFASDFNLIDSGTPKYAALTTPDDKSRKIEGASTFITVYNLSVQAPQLSEALLWIGSGVSGSYSSVEYGWTVNPQLYGDSQSRTYSQWTADGFQSTGCYNSLCPGYVQISPRLPMGSTSNPVSTDGGKTYGMDIKIYREGRFIALQTSLNQLQWDQESIAAHDLTRSCYASKLAYMDTDGEFYLPKNLPIQVTADNLDVYKADYLGKIDDDNGYTLLFGGPDHIG